MLKTIISFIIQKSKLLKSLKFRILVIVLLVGAVSITVMRAGILNDYVSRAVSNQTNNAVTEYCQITYLRLNSWKIQMIIIRMKN